ncbi:uncharacterized protein LOC110185029 [Drosophila serrata]|uniref:uncharacterized protein LOC110185029 n=1 Tax=Drosophila serrata TaxID=7274 RepID=UPI000A1CFFE1|nr:uncharacterized protein LOC110185029 [Drosophila serrata]
MNTLYMICGLYIFINIASTDERNFRVHFDEFAMKYMVPDVFEKMDCQLYYINNRSYVNAEMILKRNIGEINVRASMDFWKTNNRQKKVKLYDVQVDGCSFLRSVHKNKLFNIYVKSFKKHANVNLVCPLKANFSYKLQDWYLDELDLPPFSPIGQFRTVTKYYTQNRLALNLVTSGEIVSTK